MSTVFMFPGQGAQDVGMGADLYQSSAAAREVFDQADEILGYKLSDLCFSGPIEELSATDVQQPAILTTSIACLEAARSSEKYGQMKADYVCGLSLGEYCAYYAAGALDFPSALKLIAARATYMQEASDACDSGMVAVIGLDDQKAAEVCESAKGDDTLVVANYNCPGQVVLSGDREACERGAKLAEEAGAMKVISLDVAGAFHSPIMQAAADRLKRVLDETEFATPQIPVIANVDCEIHTEAADIRENLCRQMTGSTFWAKSIQKLLDLGADEFVEIGPKKTLTGFMRRISRRTKTLRISSAADLS